jgi:DNA helicase-2/ATP-dependent DNA helicase PcrA
VGQVAAALTERGLPVQVVGLGGLLSTPTVSEVVALLTVAADPSRGDAAAQLLSGPAMRLGAADLDALGARARELACRAADRRGAVSLVDAVDDPPGPGWRGKDGERLGEVAAGRLRWLRRALATVRGQSNRSLPELVDAAEKALGLDVEALAGQLSGRGAGARANLDAFAQVAASWHGGADQPNLAGFVAWLDAAREHERGLPTSGESLASDAVQVLTVHAAKGLEWDVVAVPGLVEARFPGYRASRSTWQVGDWRLPEPTDRGWCADLGALPHELRSDAESLPALSWRDAVDLTDLERRLSGAARHGGELVVEEERRLAYVAFTRARHELLLTAPIWTDATSPRPTSRFLTELTQGPRPLARIGPWQEMPAPAANGVAVRPEDLGRAPRPWPPAATVAESCARGAELVLAARRELVAGPPDDPAAALSAELAALLAERANGDAEALVDLAAPRHLSATDLVRLCEDPQGFARRRRRPLPAPPKPAARRGRAFHEWVERHYHDAVMVELDDSFGSGDEPDGDLAALKARFLASEWAHRRPEAVEAPVEAVIGGVAIRGRIDAVFPRDGGGAVIVDWKSGPLSPAGEGGRAVQLSAYRLAWSRLRGLDPDHVDAVWYEPSTGRTVRPTLLGEDELVAQLNEGLAAAGAGP